ncbi:MAG TPA: NADH-ubiquinone oxidoreductase-F iron-sulfur binding region domain-containing protein [Dehalococcoidales bacterium]|nr:NADH-ubiquinone oxidoreductase-F iron-sulfur binding region domain-containing protein [Dehalococcoidales bacterium]
MAVYKSPAELEKYRQTLLAERKKNPPCVTVCSGTGCHAVESQDVSRAFAEELKRNGLEGKVRLRVTGCQGFCEKGPIVSIQPADVCYLSVKAADVPEIVQSTVIGKKIIERLLYKSDDGKLIQHEADIPFYKNQTRTVFGNNRFIDPASLDDYLAVGGYSALAKALFKMTPEQVLAEVKKANLRGRGGAGFPAGQKWETTRNAPGDIKYVIVNAEEGDPGAFKDGNLLEGNPHCILEGLAIGAYAMGSHQGYVFVRQEYPLAVASITAAIEKARECGFLGKNILGSGFDFEVKVQKGAGAFVSGESSALMTAIEGRVSEPRTKYIRTSVSGVWQRPSNLNNVETWANVPLIINNGADWFAGIGTAGSKGTKIFSLTGKVKYTGLVEVPMGTTIRKIIFDFGGGIADGKKFKAVQTGGPLGGFIPESLLDMPVDYDEMTKAGSMMGSGGMIVMDENTCMPDMARYFLNFLAEESCGKCVPCREGIHQLLKIMNRICKGEGRPGDLESLEEIARVCQDFALCQLGKSAANPVMSSIKYFHAEYEAHINDKKCPAGVCKALTTSTRRGEK